MVEVDGEVVWANPAALTLLGGEVVGRSLGRLLRDAGLDSATSSLTASFGDRPGRLVVVGGDRSGPETNVEALARAATHDALTGLPNRALLLDRLGHALRRHSRSNARIAVLFIDLDGFKQVNDTLGHRGGDELLVAAARRIRSVVRPSDTVARLGGDEFVVVCEELIGEVEALGIADRIREALEAPFNVEGRPAVVSASIGLASPRSEHPSAEQLLADADQAMFRAKSRGKGRCEPFDRRMREEASRRAETAEALRGALDGDRIGAGLVPVEPVAGGAPAGWQAVARWDGPAGLLEGDALVSAAAESGLAGVTAARAAGAALKATAGSPGWVALPVDARVLADPSFAPELHRALEEAGADPGRLWLWADEAAVSDMLPPPLAEARAAGVHLAVAHFGRAGAALLTLRRLPVEAVVVDRGLVRAAAAHPEDGGVLDAVAAVAARLGLDTVAEGVAAGPELEATRAAGIRLVSRASSAAR